MHKVPSHRCPFSQNWALPIRLIRNGFRAASKPAKSIMKVPMTPKSRPMADPPDGPLGLFHAYATYDTVPAIRLIPENSAHDKCERSISTRVFLLVSLDTDR